MIAFRGKSALKIGHDFDLDQSFDGGVFYPSQLETTYPEIAGNIINIGLCNSIFLHSSILLSGIISIPLLSNISIGRILAKRDRVILEFLPNKVILESLPNTIILED